MSSRRCRALALVLKVACASGVAVPRRVSADVRVASERGPSERAQGVELSLVRGNGADACIGSDAVELEVAHRLGRNPFTRPVRQRIECLVQREDTAFVVRLFERDLQDKRLGERVLYVTSADCRDLDDALALAIALLIDPEYKPAPKTALSSTRSPGSSPVTSGDAPRIEPELPTDAVIAPHPHPHPQPRRTHASLLGATGQLRLRPFAAVGDTRVMAAFGGSIGVLPGFGPELSLSVQRRWRGKLHGYVSVLYAPERIAAGITPTIGFGLTALHLAGCVEGTARLAAFGCVGLVAGAIHSVVYEPRPVDPGERGWGAASVDGGGRVNFGPLVISIRGQLLLPIVHWKFNLASGSHIYRQAYVAPSLSIAVGTHFP